MLAADEFWSVAAQVLAERGWLVVGFGEDSEQPELGSTLDNVLGFRTRTPFTVFGRADWTDWKAQGEAFYRLRPSWGPGKAGDPNGRYYRVRLRDADASSAMSDELPFSRPQPAALPAGPPISFSGYAEPEPQGLLGVSFMPRMAARLIDLVLHLLLATVAGFMFRVMLDLASGGTPPLWVLVKLSQTGPALLVMSFLGSVAYHVTCTTIHGSTLGKMLLSMQVLRDDGSPCGLKPALIREAGYFVDALFFGLIALIAMRDDAQRKRYGDQWAHTVVCKRQNLPEASRRPSQRFLLGFMSGVFADLALMMMGLLIKLIF